MRKFLIALIAAQWVLCAASASAAAPLSRNLREDEVARCIHRTARGSVWLEKTLWGLRDQEAGWIGAEVLNSNGTRDLGVLQVNSGWLPTLGRLTGRSAAQVEHWLRFDPCFNVDVARWLFLSALKRSGDYWTAVGIYHSPTAWRQRRYSLSVAGHLRKRFGGRLFSER